MLVRYINYKDYYLNNLRIFDIINSKEKDILNESVLRIESSHRYYLFDFREMAVVLWSAKTTASTNWPVSFRGVSAVGESTCLAYTLKYQRSLVGLIQ